VTQYDVQESLNIPSSLSVKNLCLPYCVTSYI